MIDACSKFWGSSELKIQAQWSQGSHMAGIWERDRFVRITLNPSDSSCTIIAHIDSLFRSVRG